MAFAPWKAADHCTGGPTKGAKALLAYCLDEWDEDEAHSDGIYNCRPVRGAGADLYSIHAEGRAVDLGFPLVKVKGIWRANPAGLEVVQRFRPIAADVGIQCMIYNRRIWSAKSPGVDGRDYEGVDPHVGHVHLELTRTAGAKLTVATIRAFAGHKAPVTTTSEGSIVVTKPKVYGPIVWEPWNATARPGARLLRRGARGKDVRYVQKFIGVKRAGKPDGRFGDKTSQAVRWYQRMRKIKVTGRVDEATWREMLAG